MHDVERDYLVLPEDLGPEILSYPGKKIIFSKNVYSGCRAVCGTGVDPYAADDVVGVFAVSQHNAMLLRLAYPDTPVSVVRYDIRADRFPFRRLDEKRPQIAILPKAPGQDAVLYQTLRARARSGRNRLASFSWALMTGMDEQRFSAVLQASLVLVFLSVEEGLPRVPLEGMCAGCFVAAYSSGPLRECLPEASGFEYGDIHALVDYIEDLAARFSDRRLDGDLLAARRKYVAETFSASRQEADVARAWEQLLRDDESPLATAQLHQGGR
jgi:hypothetical protein